MLIVGGGIIGAASAYYLSKRGYRVTIVEKSTFGSGCSHANSGLVCPSHALPLSVPEALLKPLKSMFSSNSPFYVNPMVGPSLWSWLARFVLNCRPGKSLAAAFARYELLQSSRALYDELIETESIHCEWRQDGLLHVHTETRSMELYKKTNDYLTEHLNLSAKHYDAKGVVELEPALKESVVGGWYYESDAHFRSDRLMKEFMRVLGNQSVEIVENCTVTKIRIDSGRAVAVDTTNGEMGFDIVLIATGALAPELARPISVNLYIQPGKGYSVTTNHPDPCPRIPLILEDHSVAVTPFDSGFRLGSTMEFGGYNYQIDRERLGLLESGARHYLRVVRGETTEEEWCGLRPMTATGMPIISRSPHVGNAYIAAGHSMLGMAMGPGTGKLISEIIAGDEPHISPLPYQLN